MQIEHAPLQIEQCLYDLRDGTEEIFHVPR